MNIELFNAFLKHQEFGLKKQASESIRDFISSFKSEAEIQKWVWNYLPQLDFNRHGSIRHELFIELVYPVLKCGYLRKEFEPTLWLGKLIQNLYQNRELHEQLEWITDVQLFREAYKLNRESDEVRILLLEKLISEFNFYMHEYPEVILYGNSAAEAQQCEQIREEVAFAKGLDKERAYTEYISELLNKLNKYESNLGSTKKRSKQYHKKR